MNFLTKALLLQLWFFFLFPLVGLLVLVPVLGIGGVYLYLFLVLLWFWQLSAYCHYRFGRQEEFLHVLQTAAATQAPVEAVLRAYLAERPHGNLYHFLVGCLLFFVFPGYYWIHSQRRFDVRLRRLLYLLDAGIPLERALVQVPGVVSREVALAVAVGQLTGGLPQALHHLHSRRPGPFWLELLPRLLYPLFVLLVMLINVIFLSIFIVPKYEKIFAEFKLRLPESTTVFIDASRWVGHSIGAVVLFWFNVLVLANLLLFSSRLKWYCPGVGRLYRMQARGQFQEALGLMLESGKPLPEILDRLLEARLLSPVVARRAERLQADLEQGRPLVESLSRHGLMAESQRGLLVAAEKVQNLPWALQELGDTLLRRHARVSHRLIMVLFPLLLFGCACLVAFYAVSMFAPLVAMIEGMHG